MASAEVGDDVYGEDPTINLLQERAAALTGKEASLFVPSGTMGNQIALLIHSRRGSEVLVEEKSHILDYELGGPGVFSGVVLRPLPSDRGVLDPEVVGRAIKRSGVYYNLKTSMLALENTHNMAGGTVTSVRRTAELCAVARNAGIPVHLDGARIFNAAVALEVSVSELTSPVDSVMFCLSKGLGAPTGSILAGSREFIDEARVWRKRLGGGMRQAGILAAAGLVALDESPELLLKDHENAKVLARGISAIPGLRIDPEKVETNIVIFEVQMPGVTAPSLASELTRAGVLCSSISEREVRLVAHCNVSAGDIDMALGVIDSTARLALKH